MKKEKVKKELASLEEQLLERLKKVVIYAGRSPIIFPIPESLYLHLCVKRNYKPFTEVSSGLHTEIDFAWPDIKIGIEVNGGIDKRGRAGGHISPDGIRRDYYKNNLAQVHGWILLTFPPEYCRTATDWATGYHLLKKAFLQRGLILDHAQNV